MSTNRVKWILLIGSILGILICVFGCVNMIASSSEYNKRYPSVKLPIRILSIEFDENQREELFVQLRKVSEKHALEFYLNFYRGGEIFSIQMRGKGIEISALSKSINTTELDINFYEEDPTNPPSQETVDELYNDLKAFISEIQDVMIMEVRKSLRIKMDESQREEFFALMQKLADEHSFEFTLTFSSDKTVFHFEIHGDGFHITGEPVLGSPKEIFITFFIDYHKVPTSTSLETVDELFDELKNLLGEIPNVTINEDK